MCRGSRNVVKQLQLLYLTLLVVCFLGFPGIQIGSHVNDWNLDDERLLSVFAVSNRDATWETATATIILYILR